MQKMDEKLVLRAGDLAYVDSFAGLLPCKVKRIYVRDRNVVADVAYTVDRSGVSRGMVETYPVGSTVVPRTAVRRSNHKYRIRTDVVGIAEGWYITAYVVWKTKWGRVMRAQWTLPDEWIESDGTIRQAVQLDKRMDQIAAELAAELFRLGEGGDWTSGCRSYSSMSTEVFVHNDRGDGRIILSVTDDPTVPVGQYTASYE